MRINFVEPRLSLLDGIDRGLTHLINEVFSEGERTLRPAITVTEHEDRFIIECDLPGVHLDGVRLEVYERILEIAGERVVPELVEGSTVQFDERTWRSFSRRVRLDRTVDTSRIEADYRDGVLVVTAPRAEGKLPRRVEIRCGGASGADSV